MIQNDTNKVTTYLFIDGAYLRQNYAECVRRWIGSDGEIDFWQVKELFGAERAFYYDALDDRQRQGEKLQDYESRIATDKVFFDKIQELPGYFVRLGSLGGRDNKQQKKVDILLAVEALDHAVRRNMDRAVILSGDRDFEPLVHSLVQLGVRVEVAGDKKNSSSFLLRAADTYKRLSLEVYLKWSSKPLQARFPTTMIRQISGVSADMNAIKYGAFRGKNVTLLRQFFDKVELYNLLVEEFYGENRSLVLESSNLEKLVLYFELQHGEIEWRQAGGI